jgi:hypothetical protein
MNGCAAGVSARGDGDVDGDGDGDGNVEGVVDTILGVDVDVGLQNTGNTLGSERVGNRCGGVGESQNPARG